MALTLKEFKEDISKVYLNNKLNDCHDENVPWDVTKY